MSASFNGSRARGLAPARSVPRPRLTVVSRPDRNAPRLPFVALVVAVLTAGLVGLLLLNTGMERGAYQVTTLRAQAAELDIEQQALQLRVAALQDPQEVAARALRLGMVQNTSPAFISLATGKVLGVSVPGSAGNGFDIGSSLAPSITRLAKRAPIVAGEANSAGVTVALPGSGAGQKTKGGDTARTSPASTH